MAGKKLKLARSKIDHKQVYDLTQAIQLIKDPSLTKFDASIDVAVKLNLDTTKADQQLRGAISLPHYTGKPIRVLAITDNPQAALAAGADFAGDSDKINDIKAG